MSKNLAVISISTIRLPPITSPITYMPSCLCSPLSCFLLLITFFGNTHGRRVNLTEPVIWYVWCMVSRLGAVHRTMQGKSRWYPECIFLPSTPSRSGSGYVIQSESCSPTDTTNNTGIVPGLSATRVIFSLHLLYSKQIGKPHVQIYTHSS